MGRDGNRTDKYVPWTTLVKSLQTSAVNTSAGKKPLVPSSFQMAQVLLKRKKHFAKVGLIKACLKIVANLQQGGKCTVDKAEQMLLSNKEHSIFCLHCHIGCMHSQG